MKTTIRFKLHSISFPLIKTLTLLVIVIGLSTNSFAQNDKNYDDYSQKSTLLAIILSIQPLPIDLGNFYAGQWEKAVGYSAFELAVFVPGVVMITNGSNTSEINELAIYTLIGIYFFTKVVSAFDAGIQIGFENNRIGYQTDRDVTVLLNFNVSL